MNAAYRRAFLVSCLSPLLLLFACENSRNAEYQLSGSTMGTTFNVVIVTNDEFQQEVLAEEIRVALDDVDRHMSTYRQDAELAALNRNRSTDWIPLSVRLCQALRQALELSALSGGAFDISVGPLVDLWGFGPGASRTEPPDEDQVERARATSGRDKLELDCRVPALRKQHGDLQLDLSGYAKGLAVDNLAVLLDENGISNYLVEIGGELRSRGHNARGVDWRIAIETPDSTGRSVGLVAHLSDVAVATSGDYRNFFEHEGIRYSHTIDPRTGRPVSHDLASVTVIADSAAVADAMATALLVLGPDAGLVFAERENIAAYFLVRKDGELNPLATSRFKTITTE